MHTEDGLRNKIFDYIINTTLVLLVIATLYPLLYVLFASFSDSSQLIANKGFLYKPLGFSLEAYKSVFSNPGIIKGYGNTLFILIFGVTLNMLLIGIAAYVLSRRNVMWNSAFTLLIVFTMFFHGGLILYLIVKGVGLIDSIWATCQLDGQHVHRSQLGGSIHDRRNH